jgi:Rrf2 family protein
MSNVNHRFAVSIHILTLLAANKDDLVTSDAIAESVNTNSVVIRRTMSHLRQHGLVDSRPGTSGGWRLTRAPEQVTLYEVYHALSHDSVLSMHSHPNPDCPIGGNIQQALLQVFDQAQNAVEATLNQVTISDVLKIVTSQEDKVRDTL